VAAAARGAAATAGGGGQQDGDELEATQEVLMVMKMSNVSETVAALRGSGRHDLARRVQKLSKMRNARAHPDAGLLGDLRQYVSGSTSTSVAVPSDEDGVHPLVGLAPGEPRQCGSPSSGGSGDTSEGVACEKSEPTQNPCRSDASSISACSGGGVGGASEARIIGDAPVCCTLASRSLTEPCKDFIKEQFIKVYKDKLGAWLCECGTSHPCLERSEVSQTCYQCNLSRSCVVRVIGRRLSGRKR
jgi:hypothetical protein